MFVKLLYTICIQTYNNKYEIISYNLLIGNIIFEYKYINSYKNIFSMYTLHYIINVEYLTNYAHKNQNKH